MIDAISPLTRTIGAGAAPEAGGTTLLTPPPPAASAGAPADFGSFLAQMAASTTQSLKAGEAAAMAGVTGQASPQDVVQAVMTAEQTLQSAIAIRDKVVTAFLEIGRMQI
jgi:flagellar hook-basal body complex protein FliE